MTKVNGTQLKRLLYVEPFKRITAYGGGMQVFESKDAPSVIPDAPIWKWYTQADFLRELYPSGHKIWDEHYYPDQFVQVEEKHNDGTSTYRWVKKEVTRVALPFQRIIKVQQNIHLCGNNIFFRDSNIAPSQKSKDLLLTFKQSWLDDNMEQALYQMVNSEKCTGNAAMSFQFSKDVYGKVRLTHKVYSYLDGFVICNPVYDIYGRKEAQAILYTQYDENGDKLTDYADVWDKEWFYRFRRSAKGVKGAVNKFLDTIGLDGYELVDDPVRHGFPIVPVVVKRNRDGVCWSDSQSLIETYEKGVSQMAQNCNVLSTAIMFLKGGDVNIEGMADGRPFAITSYDSNADAKFITPNDPTVASEASLKIIKENIFLSSFTVTPPEIHSGDLPGIAIKLIYSPSLEKAMDDAADWDETIDEIVFLYKYGKGIEMGIPTDLNAMHINGSIVPYVHENTAELVNNINTSLSCGSLSKESASMHNPYSANDEYRIIEEEANKQRDLDEKEALNLLSYKNSLKNE